MFMHDDKLLDVARRESAYLHDHGLFDASIALDLLVQQRAELLEALKGLEEAYCRAGTGLTREERIEDRKRLIAARTAITKTEEAE